MKKFFKGMVDNSPASLSPEEADLLLNRILNDLHLEDIHPHMKSYRFVFMRRQIIKHLAGICCIFLLAFGLLPGTLIPAPISEVSAAPAANGNSARVEFQVDTLIPVKQITAQINDHFIDVQEGNRGCYSVDVTENGYLLLEVFSVTGMRSTQGVVIEGLDDKAPELLNHHMTADNTIVIYMTDGDGVGIDYEHITGYHPDTGASLPPVAYDPGEGCVTFPFPEEPVYLIIPDKNGNTKTILLQPVEN